MKELFGGRLSKTWGVIGAAGGVKKAGFEHDTRGITWVCDALHTRGHNTWGGGGKQARFHGERATRHVEKSHRVQTGLEIGKEKPGPGPRAGRVCSF